MQNFIQMQRYGKAIGVYFDGKLEQLEVRDGREVLSLSPEDRRAIIDLIEQEVYLTMQDVLANGGRKDA